MSPAYDWTHLAQMHRPTGPIAIAAAVRQLAAQGLKPHDISATLHLGIAAVNQALSMPIEGQQ